jgi:hypothetical protein
MNTPRLCLAVCLLGLVTPWHSLDAQPASAAAAAPQPPKTPCRTTALATLPELFTADGGTEQYLERFLVAVDCDDPNTAGDYQIWWRASPASPPSSARLVAILNDQTEACERGRGCSPAGREFDFAVEVNSWRMIPGCYVVKGIFGTAVDEYWQCTRPLVFTLAKARREP